jgi:Domain of Unknown Function with PDB structure (DUF3862)
VFLRSMLILALLILLLGCNKLTMENYGQIKVGSRYAEVVELLGQPDNCSEALFVRNCVWGSEEKNISVSFLNDQAILMTSKNLR